ncbi:MAG TPA: hypothetical protein VMT14_23515 [Burkholderiaceae bacterium]|jgi:hypothetical protein|nr:hypothetical protein [Burkholderiaceae bacterium]
MSFVSLSQAYKIAPSRRDAARTPVAAPQQTPAVNPDAQPRRGHDERGDPGHERAPDAPHGRDCDSASRSPLMRALVLALRPARPSNVRADVALERALIAFARALNLASTDADSPAQPAAVRADEAARRRAQHEEALLDAFAALAQAAGRPQAQTRAALQVELGDFLHQLARELNIDDDRAGEATQPGSLISVHA